MPTFQKHKKEQRNQRSCVWMSFGNCMCSLRKRMIVILTYCLCLPMLCALLALQGLFLQSFQSPFSVAPSRYIKCNLGSVPGSLFKTQNVQYFLHTAGWSGLARWRTLQVMFTFPPLGGCRFLLSNWLSHVNLHHAYSWLKIRQKYFQWPYWLWEE